jgi:hypothetical protein
MISGWLLGHNKKATQPASISARKQKPDTTLKRRPAYYHALFLALFLLFHAAAQDSLQNFRSGFSAKNPTPQLRHLNCFQRFCFSGGTKLPYRYSRKEWMKAPTSTGP